MLAVALLLPACLEYSPHALPDAEGRNRQELRRLLATPAPADGFRFAVVGDVQLCFDEVEAAIDDLNRRDDVAFVVQVGDFTERGFRPEFEAMDERFRRLRRPYLVVIGNHDLLANGARIYRRMFGPRNGSFRWGGVRFVYFDSNSREAGFDGTVPDVAWLAQAVTPEPSDPTPVVLLSHVPPFDGDFDGAVASDYVLATERAVASFHGHLHRYEERTFAGVPGYAADLACHRNYLIADVGPGGLRGVERVWF